MKRAIKIRKIINLFFLPLFLAFCLGATFGVVFAVTKETDKTAVFLSPRQLREIYNNNKELEELVGKEEWLIRTEKIEEAVNEIIAGRKEQKRK